ncbi:hypothetical protein Esi_0109_0060 [Ectocarpus siliculosus]|uniref:Uncharacterized protein n=1 Tax=Ectocarpus siliculosus TaxID=2880 RepID=D7FHM3_ECTSI|nr:hypothetical protein Esi_0109_0060 [Ectocarpus siliculosus]|eukprot:CBJ28580.1 hypothetical protein Esi_0109_0060 [Ectocarpus siliculosus]
MIVRYSLRLEGHDPITRVGRVHVPEQDFVLIPDTRYNRLDRYTFIPGKLEDVPKGNRIMDRLVAGFVKSLEDAGIDDQMRKGGRPTRKRQRSTPPGAGAVGSTVDLGTEQRGEKGPMRKKASKGASGDPLDVDSGASEQSAPKGRKKASVKTREAGGKKKAPAKVKKTAGKEKVSESESESDTTHTIRSARRKMTPEQRKQLTEISKSTCPDRMKERNAALAAADEVSRKREAKLLKRKKGEAKSAAVAARKGTPAPTAALHKNDNNVKAGPSNKQPAGRAAPAAASLDPCKNDQANRLTASESSFLKKLLAKQHGTESGDSEEDDDESVDHLQDARSEPQDDLENDDSQGAGDGEADEASLKVMREWRAALHRLRLTRIEGVNASITTIQNDSKDKDGNVVKALVGNPMPTAKRWLLQLAAVDVCHDDTCCPETKLLKDAVKTHPIKAEDTETPVASGKPTSAKAKGGKTKPKRSK